MGSMVGAASAVFGCYLLGEWLGVAVVDQAYSPLSLLAMAPVIFAFSLLSFYGLALHLFLVLSLVLMVHVDSLKPKVILLLLVIVCSALNSWRVCHALSS